MLHAEAPHKRIQHITTTPHTNLSKTINSFIGVQKNIGDNELPPINFLTTKPTRRHNEYFRFKFAKGITTSCLLSDEEYCSKNKSKNTNNTETKIEKSNESIEDNGVDTKNENPKVERSYSEGVVDSDEELPVVIKKPKLRIQPTDKSKFCKHSLKIIPKVMIDPNIIKRKEMIKTLKQIQLQSIRCQYSTRTESQRFKQLVKEVTDYCNINHFFTCEHKDTELKVSSFGFSQKKFIVVFKSEAENYSNWGFPKPLFLDGTEVCDTQLLEHMKKQPTVETIMNELFRIACSIISECVCM
ncbi:hypothetical protein EHI8A_063500 [Entamoeba histolytica HM-1:IMSS-B]|uniref:Uncharacterized protein n=6 Tax=Entamoeba histolytica TaxID=5759 RepID=C4M6S6_ENTH1|nr:hypothetical protein EHI_184510 [Entamoeba histolytica HM-1:IMSS]EMD44656.1 Hypothetical protein EHI5A_093270 [Entamoeba histolytica KU27]EMH74787.1 hypothetical protein EHI8A_063500 [Entamoeba histolytica HM-1:IMSS-B]EMS12933.1 hypothetical protein KM1_115510 [Entamoeba histolytica HM-3:IMSS]ENY62993.1 hypothetical protein EHI7A_144310 [Entamoeba histolytica HM-1:IMSS-A]GAT97201.1 hypothetical protein CL6EHI_184510 [Entamoeba histolytica]|eukprot:XP_649676.1 hypothetical protein EHI_184510 [Entamoeba histolytica HM-1:IMSS]